LFDQLKKSLVHVQGKVKPTVVCGMLVTFVFIVRWSFYKCIKSEQMKA